MSVIVDRKKEKFSKEYYGPASNVAWQYVVEPKGVVNIYATITGTYEDQSAEVKFSVEGIFANRNGTVDNDGIVVREINNLSNMNCDVTVEGSGASIVITVIGEDGRKVYWHGDVELEIRRDEVSPVDEPRMQITIVKMAEKKKLSWAGLRDGLNFVLVPDVYSSKNVGSPYSKTEKWSFTFSKSILGNAYTDYLKFSATKTGPGGTPTTSNSSMKFKWFTQTGNSGAGALQTVSFGFGFTTAIQGWLQNRLMFGSFKDASGVAFLWGKYDAEGWVNYPTTTPTS